VAVYELPLALVQRAGLVENRSWDGRLADVMAPRADACERTELIAAALDIYTETLRGLLTGYKAVFIARIPSILGRFRRFRQLLGPAL
jgi:hypothetical protein